MKYLSYPLKPEEYVNRCLSAGTFCRKEQFEKTTLSGKVNEWLEKDFSIYENPCRKEFIKKRENQIPPHPVLPPVKAGCELEVFGQKLPFEIYFPFENRGVERSEFYFTPTYLRSYHYVILESELAETSGFILETCGGAAIWLNGELAADFTPFTRNMVKSTSLLLPLKKGGNELLICLDDLAERDTDYYFRLQYKGGKELGIRIPVPDSVDTDRLYQAEKILDDIDFEKEAYISEPVRLNIKNPYSREINAEVSGSPVIDKMYHEDSVRRMKEYRLLPGETGIDLFHADEVIPGYYFMEAGIREGDILVKRHIGVQVFQKKFLASCESAVKERKENALRYLKDFEIENVYKAASMMYFESSVSEAERILREELDGIQLRKDCSDFHLIVVLQIYKKFGAMLSEKTKEKIKNVLLGFRFWIDEPGNDVMWFFSENHALLFHICQYVSGDLFPEEIFENSGLTGKQLKNKAEKLLEEWFDAFFKEFITEWNSNAYIPVDVLGLCGLYNLEEEGVWKEKAQKALDMIFYDLAVNSHKGALMTTFGRSYEKELKGNYTAGTTSLLYIAYNRGYLNRASLAYISFALGDYEPPSEYVRYIDLKPEESILYKKTQGYKNHVNLYLFKNKDVELSTAIAYKPFCPGYQEHIMQAAINPTAQVFINHPGEVQPYGNGRPNFWAGSGIFAVTVRSTMMESRKRSIRRRLKEN